MNKRLYNTIILLFAFGTGMPLALNATGSNWWFWNWPSNFNAWLYYSEPSKINTRTEYTLNEQKIKTTQDDLKRLKEQHTDIERITLESITQKLTEDVKELFARCKATLDTKSNADCSEDTLKNAEAWKRILIAQGFNSERLAKEILKTNERLKNYEALKKTFEKKYPEALTSTSKPISLKCPLEKEDAIRFSWPSPAAMFRTLLTRSAHAQRIQKNVPQLRVPMAHNFWSKNNDKK